MDYAAGSGTASVGADFTPANETVSFGPGEMTKTFQVAITDNSSAESAETVTLTLSNPGGGAAIGSPASASVAVADDDPAPAGPGTDLQSPPGNPNPAGSQTTGDDRRAPKVTLSGKKVQKAFKAKLLALVAKCDEDCTLTVTAKAGKTKVTVTVVASDLAGNKGTASRAVTARR